jgi:hypothetical protein
VVCVFTRTITDELAGLVSQIDKSLETHAEQHLSAFFVLMTDDPEESVARLQSLAEERELTEIPLTIYPESKGPPDYGIASNYDTTIIMWRDRVVQSNHHFQSAKLSQEGIAAVMESVRDLAN